MVVVQLIGWQNFQNLKLTNKINKTTAPITNNTYN